MPSLLLDKYTVLFRSTTVSDRSRSVAYPAGPAEDPFPKGFRGALHRYRPGVPGLDQVHAGLFYDEVRDGYLDYGSVMASTDTHAFLHRSMPRISEPGEADHTAIKLVDEGSVVNADDHVSVPLLEKLTESGRPSGRYAYWVGDQSQKALVAADPYEFTGSLTAAQRLNRQQASSSSGISRVEGMDLLADESELDRLHSMKSMDLLSMDPSVADDEPSLSRRNFHSVTDIAQTVLADVREGGLKRDLSVLLERPISLDEDGDM